MDSDLLPLLAAAAGLAACLMLLAVLLRPQNGRELAGLRLLAEQALAGLAALRSETAASLGEMRAVLAREGGEQRAALEAGLRGMAEASSRELEAIRRAVDETLHRAVERQMEASFQRVLDGFAAVQKAMGDVQATAAQIGDLRRIFANVKTRGGWGETQLRALLDDILPAGAYETNRKLREDSDEAVEFAVLMPVRAGQRPLLAIDSKFPTEDYERLLDAAERGDLDAERAARRALEARLRAEARKIAAKYICPPATVEFAALYLPTDGLYAEAARIPGLIEAIGRECRVVVLGPSLLPGLLRTIQLGFVTLALEQKADEVRRLLGATKTEMLRMDAVLDRLGRQAGAFSATIEKARVRTREVGRRLRDVEALEVPAPEDALLPGPEPGPDVSPGSEA